jgi:transcriptional regulator with XRE-family HTH domain
MTSVAKPGAILKAIRHEKGWKLSDVATKTGFPVSTLSKIENGKVSLTYEKMARLSKALSVDIGLFFTEEGNLPNLALATGRRSIVRSGDGSSFETSNYLHTFPANDLLNKRFIPIISEVHIRSNSDIEMTRHSGEEYDYVLEGTLEVHTELYAPVRLEAGDSIYFDSGMAHAYIAVGKARCRVLTICSGEESQIITGLKEEPELTEEIAAQPIGRKARKRRGAA